MERARKIKEAKEFGEKFKDPETLFLTDFVGMSVAQMTRVRKELKRIDAQFKVVKNSVLKIASKGTPVEKLIDRFVGPNAIVLSRNDPSKVAKILINISKEIPNFKVKVGLIKNRVIEGEEVGKIAALPSREVLLGQLFGLLRGSQVRLVNALSYNLFKLIATLNAIKEKKEKG